MRTTKRYSGFNNWSPSSGFNS